MSCPLNRSVHVASDNLLFHMIHMIQLVYVSEDLVQNGGGQVLRMMQPFLYIFMSLTSFCFRIHI